MLCLTTDGKPLYTKSGSVCVYVDLRQVVKMDTFGSYLYSSCMYPVECCYSCDKTFQVKFWIRSVTERRCICVDTPSLHLTSCTWGTVDCMWSHSQAHTLISSLLSSYLSPLPTYTLFPHLIGNKSFSNHGTSWHYLWKSLNKSVSWLLTPHAVSQVGTAGICE